MEDKFSCEKRDQVRGSLHEYFAKSNSDFGLSRKKSELREDLKKVQSRLYEYSVKSDPLYKKNGSVFLHEHWSGQTEFGLMIDLAATIAKDNPRGRFNFMLHHKFEEDFQCLVNAVDKQSYVRPHKHTNAPDRRETFTAVRGHLWVVTFKENGEIKEKIKLDADKEDAIKTYVIETGVMHTVISDGPFVVLELKQHIKKGELDAVSGEISKISGYSPVTDKIFADFAPEEKDANTKNYNDNLLQEVLKS